MRYKAHVRVRFLRPRQTSRFDAAEYARAFTNDSEFRPSAKAIGLWVSAPEGYSKGHFINGFVEKKRA
jgi:hypothetical protein